jgi:hypothetical protein
MVKQLKRVVAVVVSAGLVALGVGSAAAADISTFFQRRVRECTTSAVDQQHARHGLEADAAYTRN